MRSFSEVYCQLSAFTQNKMVCVAVVRSDAHTELFTKILAEFLSFDYTIYSRKTYRRVAVLMRRDWLTCQARSLLST